MSNRRRTLSVKCAIDPAWSSCLWRPSSPVRQHANSCRKNTPAQPAFPYIFSSALRAAGRSMEAALRSWAKHSGTVNLLSKLRSSSLFGTGRSRAAVPRPWLEGRTPSAAAPAGHGRLLCSHRGV